LREGTKDLVMPSLAFMERLAALVLVFVSREARAPCIARTAALLPGSSRQ